MKQNKRDTGTYYEKIAAEHLEKNGLYIKKRNFRCRQGEIDLIAVDGEYLVFVEVKYRSSGRRGSALEAVTRRKQKILSRVAEYYLACYVGNMDVPCRFDVIGIDDSYISWIKNAFDFCK